MAELAEAKDKSDSQCSSPGDSSEDLRKPLVIDQDTSAVSDNDRSISSPLTPEHHQFQNGFPSETTRDNFPETGNGAYASNIKEIVEKSLGLSVGSLTSGIDENTKDERCGCGSFYPSCFSYCNNPKFLLAVVCWFGVFQGFVVNGINNVNTTSLERRFQLPSSRVGWISSAYDVSAAIFVLPVSFLGMRGNKPKWLSFASAITALGSLVYLSPHFFAGIYDHSSKGTRNTCDLSSGALTDDCTESSLSNYLYLFIAGQAFHGVGGTVLYSIGYTLIDESVSNENSPLYIAIFYAAAGLGPALGYVIGGQFLNIYVDTGRVEETPMSASDPRWVGAWWIGLCISSICLVLSAIAVFPFPSALPGTKELHVGQKSQAYRAKNVEKVEHEDFGKSLKDIPLMLKLLSTNLTFVFITLGCCSEGLIVSACATYLPKIIQSQFLQTPGTAAIIAGLAAVPGVAGGQLFGGYLVKRKRLKVPGMIKFGLIGIIISTLGCSTFLIKCSEANLAGVFSPYTNETFLDITSPCNAHCGCSTESYEPVCGTNSMQYFSPCHAGCLKTTNASTTSHCMCIPGNNTSTSPGVCEEGCAWLYPAVIALFLTMFAAFCASPAIMAVTLRCVPHTQRLLAVGVQGLLIRCLGTVPGPVLAGAIIDSACAIWQEKCHQKGSCWLYSPTLLSRNMFLLACACKVFTVLFFFLAWKLYKPPVSKSNSSVSDVAQL